METKKKIDDGVILVGNKYLRAYADAVEIQFEKGSKEVILRTRGKNTSRAIDTAEFLRRRNRAEIKEIKTGSESFKDKESDREIFVSTVDITLTQK